MAVSTINHQDNIQIINTINTELDGMIANTQKCNIFFNGPKDHPIKNPAVASKFFTVVFKTISADHLEKYKANYQTVKNQKSEQCQDQDLEEKITLLEGKIQNYESFLTIFQTGVAQTLQTCPETLLLRDCMIGLDQPAIIAECHCVETMGRAKRQYFTRLLTNKITSVFQEKKQLTIASIGAGGCFHELTIHATMNSKNYSTDWFIVEPNPNPNIITHFKMIANWVRPNTTAESVRMKAEGFFNQLKPTNPEMPDVFLFIDVGNFIVSEDIERYGSQMKHHCLFAKYDHRDGINGQNFTEIKEASN